VTTYLQPAYLQPWQIVSFRFNASSSWSIDCCAVEPLVSRLGLEFLAARDLAGFAA